MQRTLFCAVMTLLVTLPGYSSDDGKQSDTANQATPPQRNVLRVILPREPQGMDHLPRSGMPKTEEYHLLELYAKETRRELVPVRVDGYDQLIPALLEGNGDIIADNLSVTESRKQQVSFSMPVAFVHEQLIGRMGETP